MTDLVRVRDKQTGHHITIAATAVRDHHQVLKQDAVNRNGRARPAKPSLPKGGTHTTSADPAEAKQASEATNTTAKEAS